MNGDEEAPRPEWDGHLRDENGNEVDEFGEVVQHDEHSEIGAIQGETR